MMGWKCPGCGSCYGPHVDECRRCAPLQTVTVPNAWIQPPTTTVCLHPEVEDYTGGKRCKQCGMQLVFPTGWTITTTETLPSVPGTMLPSPVGQVKFYGQQLDGTVVELPGGDLVQSTPTGLHEKCGVCSILRAEDEVAFRHIDAAVEDLSDS